MMTGLSESNEPALWLLVLNYVHILNIVNIYSEGYFLESFMQRMSQLLLFSS